VSDWTGESLRRAALDALGPHGDELARDVLAHAAIEVTPGVARWEGSAGRVEGHRIALGVDDGRLLRIRSEPAAFDAICAAIAAAVATHPGESLFELDVCPEAPGMLQTPYRGPAPGA